MTKPRQAYPTDLNDTEWNQIAPFLPEPAATGRPRQHSWRLQKIWADGGYRGQLIAWVKTALGWGLEIVEKLGDQVGFQVLPKRWIVEPTFAWLNRQCRLSKDYERLPQTSEAFVYVAMIRLMTRQLAHG